MEQFYKPEDTNYVLDIVRNSSIVYASMEIGVHPHVHTMSGGLGVLAGDTLKSCADLELPVTGITLLYRHGYFVQVLDNGYQREEPEPWDVDAFTTAIPEGRTSVFIEGREVIVEPRLGIIVGHEQKHLVPILFLDTFLNENDPQDRWITAQLYGGDHRHRLKQEAVLGIAGKRVLRKLGCRKINTFHMNEGHAALAPMEDVQYLSKYYSFNKPLVRKLVRSAHVFTTHTPVPAGHDRFTFQELRSVLGEDEFAWDHVELGGPQELNMTQLALNLSRYANGVAKRHGEVSRRMFPGYEIDAITNGVHLPTWMAPPICELLDEEIPSWREQPQILEHCYDLISYDAIWEAHQKSKQRLIDFIQQETGKKLHLDRFTVGFARRFATYKRADLIFTDLNRLREIGSGKLQLVFAGEAHPSDSQGKAIIKRVIDYARELEGDIEMAFIPDYGMDKSKYLISGCDLWLNNPVPPKEASGTSGMKAAANGIPNLSTLDGWWIEGITQSPLSGWIIQHRQDGNDSLSLYEQLDHILRVYYDHPQRWREHMVHALSLASYFNTHRMVQEYERKAWTLKIY